MNNKSENFLNTQKQDQKESSYKFEIKKTHVHDAIIFNVTTDIKGVENFVVDTFLKILSEMGKREEWTNMESELKNTENDIRENFKYTFEGYAPHQIRIYVTPDEEKPNLYRVQFYDNLGILNELGGIDKFTRELLSK